MAAETRDPSRSLAVGAKERRKQPRRPAARDVRIYWQDSTGKLLDAPGIVRNVSDAGLGVEVHDLFSVGQLLSIAMHDASLQGVVRHVQEHYSSYLVGIEVLAESDGVDHLRMLQNVTAKQRT
jgi:hypothetical protein